MVGASSSCGCTGSPTHGPRPASMREGRAAIRKGHLELVGPAIEVAHRPKAKVQEVTLSRVAVESPRVALGAKFSKSATGGFALEAGPTRWTCWPCEAVGQGLAPAVDWLVTSVDSAARDGHRQIQHPSRGIGGSVRPSGTARHRHGDRRGFIPSRHLQQQGAPQGAPGECPGRSRARGCARSACSSAVREVHHARWQLRDGLEPRCSADPG